MSTFNVNLHEAVYSLSDALDLVGVSHIHHGKRVAFMAAECGKKMGWDAATLDYLFQAAMLHDVGVSRTSVHARLAQFEWEQDNSHTVLGESLLRSCPLLAPLAPVVRHHHTHWSDFANTALAPETRLAANCIFMVDRVDVLALAASVDNPNLLLSKDEIRRKIADKRGTWFAPELVDAFLDVSALEAFWFSLEGDNVRGYARTWLSQQANESMSFPELKSVVQIFAHVVDAKSPFTRSHSEGVAKLCRYLGELFQLPEENCDMLELAGLLHDIGKLRQPDELLEKRDKFTTEEYADIQRHSFDTYSIIGDIRGLEKIALWAAQHHERNDGSGYPYHLKKDRLTLEARIVAVADVFQALAQQRPYRDPLPIDEILEILEAQAASGGLDAEIVACTRAHANACWDAAMLSPGRHAATAPQAQGREVSTGSPGCSKS